MNFRRFLMSLGKVEEAKKVLTQYSKLAKKPLDLTGVNLIFGESTSKDEGMSTSERVSRYM